VLDGGLDGGLDTFCEIVYTLCDLLQRGRKDGVKFAKVGKLTGHVLRDLVQSGGKFRCERVDICWISFSLRHSSSQEVAEDEAPIIYTFVFSFSASSASSASSSFTCLSDVELVIGQQINFICGVHVPTDDSNGR